LLTGIFLWIIWQASAMMVPLTAAKNYHKFLASLPPGWIEFFRPWTREEFGRFYHVQPFDFGQWWTFGAEPSSDALIIHTWIGFLPLACLLGVLFTILKPLHRFLLWLGSIALVGFVYAGCLHVFHYALPGTPAIYVLSCFYLCGTIIHLEIEKVERNHFLAIDLIQQAEDERKRIARDLHDESLQSLSQIVRLLEKCGDQFPDNVSPDKLRSMLEKCIQGTRDIINDLHPAALKEFGLAACIEHFLLESASHANVVCKFENLAGEVRFPDLTELCIYRIVQEAVNNIWKHADASEMAIIIERTDSHMLIKVSDNGKGNVRRKMNSSGIHNIMHRAGLIGAHVAWKKPECYDSGTMLYLRVPLMPCDEEGTTCATLSTIALPQL
jgi:hypothetical protein